MAIPKSNVTVYMPQRMLESLHALAAHDGRSLSSFIEYQLGHIPGPDGRPLGESVSRARVRDVKRRRAAR